MTSKNENLLAALKESYEAVGGSFTLLSGFSGASLAGLPYWLTSSRTLAHFLAGAAVLGAIIAYFLFAARYKGVALVTRGKVAIILLVVLLICVFFTGTTLAVVLNPELSQRFSWIKDVRTFLIEAHPMENIIPSVGSFFTAFFLIGILVVLSPAMKKGH